MVTHLLTDLVKAAQLLKYQNSHTLTKKLCYSLKKNNKNAYVRVDYYNTIQFQDIDCKILHFNIHSKKITVDMSYDKIMTFYKSHLKFDRMRDGSKYRYDDEDEMSMVKFNMELMK